MTIMSEWRYTAATRCPHCDGRACLPEESIADRFIAKSAGRLEKMKCPAGWGWHLNYRAVERADAH